MGQREHETPQGKLAEALVGILGPLVDTSALSRADIAERLGVTPGAITQALSPDKYDASLPMLNRIADLLGVDLNYKIEVWIDWRNDE